MEDTSTAGKLIVGILTFVVVLGVLGIIGLRLFGEAVKRFQRTQPPRKQPLEKIKEDSDERREELRAANADEVADDFNKRMRKRRGRPT